MPGVLVLRLPRVEKTGFTSQQQRLIREAVDALIGMLRSRLDDLERWDRSAQAAFKKAFGTTDVADRQMIRERVERMLALCERLTPEDNFKPADPDEYLDRGLDPAAVYASVRPKDPGHVITLGEKFWWAPPTGQDSRAGTLGHELSHFLDIGATVDEFPGDPVPYGLPAARALARRDSSKALMHADSFEYWVEGVS